ncbi:peptide ABC transporter substrate-binding protein [Enterovibrio norvegicus FF-454]|uniref:Peptide ABC transporter substrate-binding protein n=1 Tax=Enterovibrio norvegicus FF-454 TaxID=1185651 RepID=A0A1E5CBD4_9GAMM|nr:ABC transporter substrate-binding protein [Enterovibrio norvegicus]OEE62799.1 peptide ABC transporter substrate-binding protein [Enterovibrio norvegicus FF-454]
MLSRLLTLCFALVSFAGIAATHTLTIIPELSNGFVRNYNPFRPDKLATTRDFIFEPLMVFEDDVTHYRLAKSYALSPDLKGITLTLRDGIQWSDGVSFSADDVVFSLSLLKNEPELDYNSLGEWIERVEKRGENEVYVSLTRPNAQIALRLQEAIIVPEHQWKDIRDKRYYLNATPVGSGPFTDIRAFSSNNVVQCRNPNYWQQDALKIDCIRYPLVRTNDELISRLSNGEFDWASAFIPDIERNYSSYSPDYHYHHKPSTIVSLLFNFNHPDPETRNVIQDVRFRRAISMSLARDLIIDIAVFGQGEKAAFASGLESKFDDWIVNSAAEQHLYYIRFHPNTAARLLDEMGLKDTNDDGFRELPSGAPLSLSLIAPSGWSDFTSAANITAEMLNAIGIKIDSQALPFSKYTEQMAEARYDMSITNYFSGMTPFRYLNSAFNSRYQTPLDPRFAQHYFRDEEINQLLDAFLLETTQEGQRKVINRLHLLISEQQVTVPLYYKLETVEFTKNRFKGWRRHADGTPNVPPIWYTERLRLIQLLALEPVDGE